MPGIPISPQKTGLHKHKLKNAENIYKLSFDINKRKHYI